MTTSKNLRLLIIGSVWPEPDSSAAGQRMMQLIDLFKSEGWHITFTSSSQKSTYATNLTEHNISTKRIAINDEHFDNFIADLQPSVVIFDRFITEEQFGWRVAEQCPGALRILDTEDLHSLRRARKKALYEGGVFKEQALLQEETAKREIASIYRCDLSLIISEYEMNLLQNLFGVDESLFYYLPFMVDSIDESAVDNWPGFEERNHFITVGNFRHAPNRDSVKYLHEVIWPLIGDKLPAVEMHVYGAYPPKRAQALHQPEDGFLIKGRAANAQKVVQRARVCLAPLRFGAGLKGKLVEAMQCGTPSVTTPVGTEGLAGELSWSGIVAENEEQLARGAVRLYTDQQYWKQAQKQGRKILNKRFSNEQGGGLLKHIHQLQLGLKDHRRSNFTGAMLMHHTAASTKFMGRWIEAKNS